MQPLALSLVRSGCCHITSSGHDQTGIRIDARVPDEIAPTAVRCRVTVLELDQLIAVREPAYRIGSSVEIIGVDERDKWAREQLLTRPAERFGQAVVDLTELL